ncbi:MAG TPA: retropepsin-like aspartic protease [Terriglobales bacterium]
MSKAVRKSSVGLLLFSLAAAVRSLAGTAPGSDPNVAVQTLHDYLMVVTVTVNDRGPFRFLLDTGTNTTLIDPELAQELKLTPVDGMTLGSMGKSVPVARYFLQGFRVGEASVSNLEVLALTLPQLRALDRRIRGVLGMNFLLQFSFLLDYQQQRLEIYPFPELAHPPQGTRLRAEINDWRLLIPVGSKASPRGMWKLTLDSGISEVLVFENRMDWSAGGFDRCIRANCLIDVSSNLSRENGSTVRVHQLSIADTSMRDVPVVVLPDNLAKPTDASDGLLPTSMFGSVFFDRSDATVVFSPRLPVVAAR